MSEETKTRRDVRSFVRTVPEPEELNDEENAQLANLHSLRSEIAARRVGGEQIPDNATIVKEAGRLERKLGRTFLDAAKRGHAPRLAAYLTQRFRINYADPKTGETALHILAAGGARRALRTIMAAQQRLNFLVRDKRGRLSSELAYLYGDDPVMSRLLANKERWQAKREGVRLTRRPPPKNA